MSRILIVDDEPHICEALQDSLQAEGYDVIVAHDGQTALALITLEARRGPITGVILDMEMPVVHGIELLRQLRKSVSGSSYPNDLGHSRQAYVRGGHAQRREYIFSQAVWQEAVDPSMRQALSIWIS